MSLGDVNKQKMLLRSLKSMMSIYNDAMGTVTMSLSCVRVGEIVSVHGYCCEWLMSSFWGLERTSFWQMLWHQMLGALN